jgi:hypothetical protein
MSAEDFARIIAERKGITVEEHLRRLAEQKRVRSEINSEEGIEEPEDEE